MSSIVNYTYDKNGIKDIADWPFGKNWPVVYVIYNDSKAYVGETLDAVRRTGQHLQEEDFISEGFTSICLISNKTFNKSVVLDLESYLIKYMGAEGSKELTNDNAGVVDHNYFYREAYEDDFKEIWSGLIKLGIVRKSIIDVENSELFKYSPYKTLNMEQQRAAYEILHRLNDIDNASAQSLIAVTGGAGTGKTILAVYLVKLLTDISAKKKVWNSIEDSEDSLFVEKISKTLSDINNIGFVVPMRELRETMQTIFKSVDGLREDMVLAPEDVVKNYYDLLVVDEAHRLYKRKNLPGAHLYIKYDAINKSLMADSFSGTVNDYTQLDWIIKSSRMQILFYDKNQTIRVTDIGPKRFDEICRPHLFKYVELFSQMRCKGGNGYYEYVKQVLEQNGLKYSDYRRIDNYDLKVFDNIEELFAAIQERENDCGLCKVVTGPGWSKDKPIMISGKTYHWAENKDDKRSNVVFSIHKTQGFDLNYAGVIFGKEVYYDEDTKSLAVDKTELEDIFTKISGDVSTRQYILNIYVTLMTRGIHGTYIYAVDERLREYLKQFFS